MADEKTELTAEVFEQFMDEVNDLKKRAGELNSQAGGITRQLTERHHLIPPVVSWCRKLRALDAANRQSYLRAFLEYCDLSGMFDQDDMLSPWSAPLKGFAQREREAREAAKADDDKIVSDVLASDDEAA